MRLTESTAPQGFRGVCVDLLINTLTLQLFTIKCYHAREKRHYVSHKGKCTPLGNK